MSEVKSHQSLKLPLVESFLSVQGEGKYQGRLAIFLRFFGCNLNCAGFGVQTRSKKTGEWLRGCDTARAVFAGHFDAPKFSCEQILDRINELCAGLNLEQKKTKISDVNFKPIVVMTGGEPLLHYKNKNFLNLLHVLIEQNFEVHFETNGTIEIDFATFPIYKKCKFALGVKLANSGVSETKRINPAALKAFVQNAECFYKFVLREPDASDLEQILQVLNIAVSEVWCMPMGESREQIARNAPSVANFAVKYGLNYSERIHVRLWDKKEGV